LQQQADTKPIPHSDLRSTVAIARPAPGDGECNAHLQRHNRFK
jgi:hypothetical protein